MVFAQIDNKVGVSSVYFNSLNSHNVSAGPDLHSLLF